jgi:hypothetical protein
LQGGGGQDFLPPEPPGPEPDLGAAPGQAWESPAAAAQPAPTEPDNGAAVAGFITSLAAAVVLMISFGFAGVLTAIAAPFGIHYSRKGKAAIREGRTRRHAGLAQAGFVIGIIVLVLSVLAVIGLILFIIFEADDTLDPGRGIGTQT